MNYQVLIDRKHGMNKAFVPSNLVDAESKYKESIKLEAKVYQHWLALKERVAEEGYIIEIQYGYCSYEDKQKELQEEIEKKGEEYAYKAVAIPGYSEHQTGLAIDYCILKDKTFIIEEEMDRYEECSFTNNIAHEYGFILRYPKGKEEITGYRYEPWHLRYVGKKLATYLYENNLTLDEYYIKNNK